LAGGGWEEVKHEFGFVEKRQAEEFELLAEISPVHTLSPSTTKMAASRRISDERRRPRQKQAVASVQRPRRSPYFISIRGRVRDGRGKGGEHLMGLKTSLERDAFFQTALGS